jgi:hypothetical protein
LASSVGRELPPKVEDESVCADLQGEIEVAARITAYASLASS